MQGVKISTSESFSVWPCFNISEAEAGDYIFGYTCE